MQKRVAIWAAVSSLPQAKKISLTDQLRQGHEAADRHQGEVVTELVVPGESRNIILFEDARDRIDAYAQLKTILDARMEELKTGVKSPKAVDALIYLDLSRLGRTAPLILAVAELCTRAQILLYELDSPPPSLEFSPPNYDELLLRAIKATGAQQEVRKIQDKHRSGMIGRVKGGKFPSRINYGYREIYNADGEFVEYAFADTSDVVLLMHGLYIDRGWGHQKIADHLNRLGHDAPNGGQWNYSTVAHILRRAWIYAGYAEVNRRSKTGRPHVRAKGIWPALISEERARAIMAELESRKNSRRSVAYTYRFSRMCYCNICGDSMAVDSGYSSYRKKDGTRQRYDHVRYRCRGRHGSGALEHRIHQKLAAAIVDLNDESHREEIVVRTTENNVTVTVTEINSYQAQIEELQKAIKKADNDYYIHKRFEGADGYERYSNIVRTAKESILAAQVEITRLQDELHNAERLAHRGAYLKEISEVGLTYLNHEDVRTSNAWLHSRFRIWVEFNTVVAIEVL